MCENDRKQTRLPTTLFLCLRTVSRQVLALSKQTLLDVHAESMLRPVQQLMRQLLEYMGRLDQNISAVDLHV